MSDGPVLVGVDVGNSKTRVAVADRGGRVLAVAAGPGGNPQVLGPGPSWELIARLVRAALEDAGAAVTPAQAFVSCAVAGLDFAEDDAAFAARAPSWFRQAHLAVGNDTFAVLWAGGHADGVAVVVGAGANCVGRLGGRVVRFHGLGSLSGDWGGGLMIAEGAVAAAVRGQDGRGRPTALAGALPPRLGFATLDDLLRAVVGGRVARLRLADLAPVVLDLADAGDPVSVGLVRRQAREVADFARAAIHRLDAAGAALPIVLGGGILQSGCRALRDAVGRALSEPPLRASPVEYLTRPPVHGCLLDAADRAGHQERGRATPDT